MKNFYYSDGNNKFGPFSIDELKTKGIKPDTLVWYDDLKDWQPAGELEVLSILFADSDNQGSETSHPPPVPDQDRSTKRNTPPKSWLVESILVTIFCCLPFGIVGIIYAAGVESKFNAGDYEGSLKASRDAGMWTKLSFWIGLGIIVLYSIMVMAGVITSFSLQ
jgi:hypothetical protein